MFDFDSEYSRLQYVSLAMVMVCFCLPLSLFALMIEWRASVNIRNSNKLAPEDSHFAMFRTLRWKGDTSWRAAEEQGETCADDVADRGKDAQYEASEA